MTMSRHLLFHHLKKDIRHLKLPLLAWFILLVVIHIHFLLMAGGMPGAGGAKSLLIMILLYLEPLLASIIIALVIQADSPVDSRAFWLTRPLTPKTLLAAKILFILIFLVGMPLLARTAVMLLHGVLIHDILLAVIQLLIMKLAFIVPLVVIAALTPNITWYLLLGAILLVGGGIAGALLFGGSGSPAAPNTFQLSRILVSYLLLIAVGAVVILHQFLSRRTRRSVIFAALGIILLTAAWFLWQWNFLGCPVPVLNENDPLVRDIFLFSDGHTRLAFSRSGYKELVTANAYVDCYGEPRDRDLILNALTGISLTASDGTALHLPVRELSYKRTINYFFGSRALDYFFRPSITAIHAYRSRQRYRYEKPRFNTEILRFPQKINIENPGTSEITYSARATFDLIRYNNYAELPLKPGYKYKEGSESLQVLGIEREPVPGKWWVRAKLQSLNSWFARVNKKPALHLKTGFSTFKLGFALHNKKRKEVFFARNIEMRPVTLYPFQIVFLKIGFPYYFAMKDETWLADAELVCFEAMKTARFSKPFVIRCIYIDNYLGERLERKTRRDLLLEKITLPENPTVSQVRQYIGKILAIRFRLLDPIDEDPRPAKLAKVGPAHIHILAEMGNRFHQRARYYASQAMNRLAGPEHKKLILKIFNTYPALIGTVVRENWINEAKDTIIKRLRQNPLEFPAQWLETVISFKDPSTYADLHRFFLYRNPDNLVKCYHHLKNLPGFDVAAVAAAVWEQSKYKRPGTACKLIPIALEEGFADALEKALQLTKDSRLSENEKAKLRRVIRKFTRYKGEK